jgi:hypothetical protein
MQLETAQPPAVWQGRRFTHAAPLTPDPDGTILTVVPDLTKFPLSLQVLGPGFRLFQVKGRMHMKDALSQGGLYKQAARRF